MTAGEKYLFLADSDEQKIETLRVRMGANLLRRDDPDREVRL